MRVHTLINLELSVFSVIWKKMVAFVSGSRVTPENIKYTHICDAVAQTVIKHWQ